MAPKVVFRRKRGIFETKNSFSVPLRSEKILGPNHLHVAQVLESLVLLYQLNDKDFKEFENLAKSIRKKVATQRKKTKPRKGPWAMNDNSKRDALSLN